MKRTIQTMLLTLLCLLGLCTAASAAYTDVPEGAWYAPAVAYCQEHGLMDGTRAGRFEPNKPMTRAMLATVLYRLSGSPPASGDTGFPDVKPTEWYVDAIYWASRQGYMRGYDTGLFGPDDPLTREQLAAAFWRYAGSPQASPGEDFADEAEIYDFAVTAVDWARSARLLTGMEGNAFSPRSGATRAQLAMLLMNFASPGLLTEVSAMDIMCQPCGAAAMEDGSLLVTDSYNRVIWRLQDGVSSLYAGGDTVEDLYGRPLGGYNDAALADSFFRMPWAIAPFLDGWAVADAENNAVRLLRPAATETINGHTEEKLAVTALGVAFRHPTGLAADGEGNLYVADTYENAIRRIDPEGNVVTVAANLSEPMGLCWWNGALYAAESGANRIVRVDPAGEVTVMAGSGEAGYADGEAASAAFSGPQGVAVGPGGEIYVSDTDNSAIRIIQDGQVMTLVARDVTNLRSFFPIAPAGLLVEGDTLYICDTFARKLLAFPLW